MGLLSSIRSMFSSKPTIDVDQSKSNIVGNKDPICPYCDDELDKMPGRKKKCLSCENFIYVRTSPKDKVKILIREDQIDVIEELWSIENGTHDQYIAEKIERAKVKKSLTEKWNLAPSEEDIRWSQLSSDLVKHADGYQWGLYRNARLGMGDILKKKSYDMSALDTYLEVCYIDINGPSNCGTKDPDIFREYPPFNPKSAFLAPGVLRYVEVISTKNNLSSIELKERFLKVATKAARELNLPVKATDAWEKLVAELS